VRNYKRERGIWKRLETEKGSLGSLEGEETFKKRQKD